MTTQSRYALLSKGEGPLPRSELLAIIGLFYAAILLAVIGVVAASGSQALIGAIDVLQLGDPIVAMAFTA